MNEGTCTGLILYGDVETVKQLMANFVKVERNVHLCPLASRGELVLIYSFGRMSQFASTGAGLLYKVIKILSTIDAKLFLLYTLCYMLLCLKGQLDLKKHLIKKIL